jgi:hypothetical protein
MTKTEEARRERDFALPAHTCVDQPNLPCPACALHSLATGAKYERIQQEKLKGVQLPLLEKFERSYRVRLANGRMVLCRPHLEALRAKQAAPLTGETFDVKLCDQCLIEAGKGHEL